MIYEKLVNSFEHNNPAESIPNIQEFICRHRNSTSLPELDADQLRDKIWSGFFSQIEERESSEENRLLCLTSLKILIRDKTDLSKLVTEDRVLSLMKSSHLSDECNELPNSKNRSRIVEAVKCLYNIVLNFNSSASLMYGCGIVENLVGRVIRYSEPDGFEVKLFDLKLLFLITAFCKESRIRVLESIGGMKFFSALLAAQLKELKEASALSEASLQKQMILADELKIIFNVLMDFRGSDMELHEPSELRSLVAVSREFLAAPVVSSNVKSDVINLLTLIPMQHLSSILTEELEGDCRSKDCILETGLQAVSKVMDYLDKVLTDYEDQKSNPNCRELLPPVLLALLHLAKSGSIMRKHIRGRILPKLTEKEVFTRPEEGNTLRNKLCRLLTSPITNIMDVTADLLFVLCKESVGRMVKYTGYGNAAGLFARRGLMARPLEYSSDSEGSDTEEYNKHKEFINPVVGCRTPSHPDPMEGMTEEQKEVLAMELVNNVDKLIRNKVVQPCTTGPDGRPKPIEHVLELQQSIKNAENEEDCSDEE
ncbi:Guanine nucleotide-Hypothetical protein protein G(I)/G(S)/G(O) subunit gamma-2 [Nesidiocoris tenuis]|uniref:Synembryn-A n=2 Tax=Nesidiocoris tenuis TaxID=355587 RepID=A0ABN7B408_9HEMI|nr:Guanine nucleotide-Hypothetical protein protein G(I)/G(S)/G(O) subunit gamma-2 [Nesidiocoris tenuis]